MPNWSYNTIAIRGKKQDIVKILNDGVKNTQEKFNTDMNIGEFENLFNKMNTDKQPLHLRSWLPMPQTFEDYDTTNNLPNFDYWCTYGKGKELTSGLTPEEQQIKYNEFVENWNLAQKKQLEEYNCVGWYNYNLKTLGTKWDTDLEYNDMMELKDDTFVLKLNCDTAWSLPTAWLNTMQDNYPELTFYCFAIEESLAYCGYFAVRDEDWVENEEDVWDKAKKLSGKDKIKVDDLTDDDYDAIHTKENDIIDEIKSHFEDYITRF